MHKRWDEKGGEEKDQLPHLILSLPSPPASNLLPFHGESLGLLSVLAQEGLCVLGTGLWRHRPPAEGQGERPGMEGHTDVPPWLGLGKPQWD